MNKSIIIDKRARNPSFFNFDIFITPLFIKILFYLLSIASIISGIMILAFEPSQEIVLKESAKNMQVYTGIAVIVFGPIAARLWCETLIILFKIFEELQHLNNR